MAIDPATAKEIAKAVISQITDEEKRQRLIIGIVVGVMIFILIIMTPILILTSTIDKIKAFFGFGDDDIANNPTYAQVIEIQEKYSPVPTYEELVFNGSLPMPVNNAIVTSEFGARIHPVTRKAKFSYRNRFSRGMA